ncbi:hypothetical protein A2U01_0088718, partial [Trifolium medium]|nr:hypothetical protein [Trifolium medium]
SLIFSTQSKFSFSVHVITVSGRLSAPQLASLPPIRTPNLRSSLLRACLSSPTNTEPPFSAFCSSVIC